MHMGRKSSAKAQSRPGSPTTPPSEPGRSFTPLLGVAIAALVIVGVFVYARTAQQNQAAPSPPARPMEIVRAAYTFAAEHPEVLSYVPCYCGCERSGHRGNEDCFVTARDANGDVTQWEPHGMT